MQDVICKSARLDRIARGLVNLFDGYIRAHRRDCSTLGLVDHIVNLAQSLGWLTKADRAGKITAISVRRDAHIDHDWLVLLY